MIGAIRAALPTMEYMEDVAYNEIGEPYYIVNGTPYLPEPEDQALNYWRISEPEVADNNGKTLVVSAPGFVKWVVDGIVRAYSGKGTRISDLIKPTVKFEPYSKAGVKSQGWNLTWDSFLRFEYRSGMLFINLPSGRCLSYVKPRISPNQFGGESVQYLGLNAVKKWNWIESYGPKFVENIVQGISRDLLCEAMLRLEKKGYRIVAHVHDEVIIEAEQKDSVEKVCSLMGLVPDWSQGLQLRADGYECEFYRKD